MFVYYGYFTHSTDVNSQTIIKINIVKLVR